VVRIAAADGAVTLSCNRTEGTVKLSRTSSAREGSESVFEKGVPEAALA
jgi:hypothetical protein